MPYNKWRKAVKECQEVGREIEKNDVEMKGTEFSGYSLENSQ